MDLEYEFGRFWFPRVNKVLAEFEDDEVAIKLVQRGEMVRAVAASKSSPVVVELSVMSVEYWYWMEHLYGKAIDMGKFVEAAKREVGKVKHVQDAKDVNFQKLFPAIWDMVTTVRYSDGSPRTPATVLMFVEDGRWKLCLSDRDTGRVCFLAADTQDGLLPALEEALQAGNLDWRVSRGASAKKVR